MMASIQQALSRKILSVAVSTAIALCSLSGGANAVTYIGTLSADAGTYAPVALGDDVTLDACGSSFESGFPTASSFSLCDSPTVSDVAFEWTVLNTVTFASTTALGSVLTLTTGGLGDFVNSVGSYFVTLNVVATLNPIALGGGDSGFISGSTIDNDGSSFTMLAASVPEPSAALLLLPALVVIAGRQRRRRKLKAA
jgi:hypothetical protein